MNETLAVKLATALYKDPAKVAIVVTIAAIVSATIVALTFLPVETQNVLYGTFSSTLSALLAGLSARKRAWSPESVEAEADRAYRKGVSAGLTEVN
jgi:hypothetical protein